MSQRHALFARGGVEKVSSFPLSLLRPASSLLQKLSLSILMILLQNVSFQFNGIHFSSPLSALTIKNYNINHHPHCPRSIKPYQNLLIIFLRLRIPLYNPKLDQFLP